MKIRKNGRVVGTKKRPAVTYVLRTCEADMSSSHGYVWPTSGPVVAEDWMPTAECGHGLHGWLMGEGDGTLGVFGSDIKWLVVEVERKLIVDLGGKVKFPRGVVVFCGGRGEAVKLMLAKGAHPQRIIGGSMVVADNGTASLGDGATVSGGYGATVSGGDGSTVVLRWWDAVRSRWRLFVGYVGEDGVKPNTKYRLNAVHEIEEVVA